MENTIHTPFPKQDLKFRLLPFWVFAILGLLVCLTYSYFLQHAQKDRVQMEKPSGKNGKHANPKARSKAEEQYQKAKEEFDRLNQKPKKTKDETRLLDKLKKQVEHWRQKKDWKGENHSQKNKGN